MKEIVPQVMEVLTRVMRRKSRDKTSGSKTANDIYCYEEVNDFAEKKNIKRSGYKHTKPKTLWDSEQDQELVTLIQQYGETNQWAMIGKRMKSPRTGKQCRERYNNHLKEGVVKGGWTAEEDSALKRLKEEIGCHWARIAKLMPGRSDNNVKNRWHLLQRREAKDQNESPIQKSNAKQHLSPVKDESPSTQQQDSANSELLLNFCCEDDSLNVDSLLEQSSDDGWSKIFPSPMIDGDDSPFPSSEKSYTRPLPPRPISYDFRDGILSFSSKQSSRSPSLTLHSDSKKRQPSNSLRGDEIDVYSLHAEIAATGTAPSQELLEEVFELFSSADQPNPADYTTSTTALSTSSSSSTLCIINPETLSGGEHFAEPQDDIPTFDMVENMVQRLSAQLDKNFSLEEEVRKANVEDIEFVDSCLKKSRSKQSLIHSHLSCARSPFTPRTTDMGEDGHRLKRIRPRSIKMAD